MAQAVYTVQSRANSNLQLAGIIDDYATLDMTLRFNDVSEWMMTIPRQSLHLANLVPISSPLGINGNGLIITRDYGAGPAVILSGPITHLDYKKSSQLVTIKGYDDSIWLKWRRADTVPASYPYNTEDLADSPLRFYKLAESSGTTATDASGHSNGTYSASGVTYAQPGAVDDLDTSVTLNGSTGWISVPTAGLPSGNSAYFMHGWAKWAAAPAGTQIFCSIGTTGSNGYNYVGLSPTGIQMGNSTVASPLYGGAAAGIWHHIVGMWTGSAWQIYVDGVLQINSAQSAQNITYGAAAIGANPTGAANLFAGSLAKWTIGAGNLSAARIQTLYLVGRSRCADTVSDNRAGKASTVMIAYVNNNAGPGTVAARQVANLSMAADLSIGGQVTGVARGDVLLTILQDLALQSGDNVGFKIQQTYLTGPNTLSFSVYALNDKTASVIFSDDLGNLADYSYSVDYPVNNNILMGGSGGGITRAFQEGQDSGSIATYGRIEGFLNGAASNDYQTMVNGISAQLLQDSAQTNLSILPIDTAGLQYQRDYNLGDKATAIIEGQTIQDKIREIKISLKKGQSGAPDELITPALGQQALAAASDSLIASAIRSMTANTQRANKKIAKIEKNQ